MSTAALHAISILLVCPATPPCEGGGLVSSRMENRVIKSFDFDERKLGNFESMPINWRRISGPGYPRFLEPQFDTSVGHDASPSLYLKITGGNLGVYYLAKDIDVHPGCDYLVSAWIKPQALAHAGALISAYYLDHAMTKISESEVFSPTVRGDHNDEPWHQITTHLAAGCERARWIGLSCRVQQAEQVAPASASPRPIAFQDVHAGAWFDDITVLRMPRVSLTCPVAGNVFTDDQPTELIASVADLDGKGIEAALTIRDAAGRTVHHAVIPAVASNEPGEVIRLPRFQPGLYTASLDVLASQSTVSHREIEFARLAPAIKREEAGAQDFGLVLDAPGAADTAATLRLIEALSPNMVQLPVWHDAVRDEAILKGDPQLDALLKGLARLRIDVSAALNGPPASLRALIKAPADRIFDLLALAPSNWRAHLALLLTRYGEQISCWQLGDPFDPIPAGYPTLMPAIKNLREEIRPLLGAAKLSTAVNITESPSDQGQIPLDRFLLTVPPSVPTEQLPGYIESFHKAGLARVSVALIPSDSAAYDRLPRTADWAKRIILAKAGGADQILIRQPWAYGRSPEDASPAFDELLFPSRTLSQCLAGMECLGPVWIGHDVEAWLFANRVSNRAALAVWATAAGARPQTVRFDFGADTQIADMWGSQSPLPKDKAGASLSVDAMPIIVGPFSASRAATIASFDVDCPGLNVQTDPITREIRLTNRGESTLRGRLRLRVPPGWQIHPESMLIDIQPRREFRAEVRFTLPTNASAGDHTLTGQLDLEGRNLDQLILRTPLHVGSLDAEMSLLTHADGDAIVLTQRVTNLSDRTLQLRAALLAPEIERQNRLIPSLAPGQTTIREYRLANPRRLAGHTIRASIEEIGGPVRLHQSIRIDQD